MIRLFLYDSTWFNADNDTDAQNLLDKGAVEYTSDQIRGVEELHHNKHILTKVKLL
jgi:hypothetical protein